MDNFEKVKLNLRKSPKEYHVSQYFDLVKNIQRFYEDGIITDAELKEMQDMRRDTLTNYQVAADMLHKMDPAAPGYDKLKSLVNYFHRCWILMDDVTDKSKIINDEQKTKENTKKVDFPIKKKQKKTLKLNMVPAAAALVLGLSTQEKRREASREEIAQAVAKMPREVKEKTALEIANELQAMKQADLVMARKKLQELENERNS